MNTKYFRYELKDTCSFARDYQELWYQPPLKYIVPLQYTFSNPSQRLWIPYDVRLYASRIYITQETYFSHPALFAVVQRTVIFSKIDTIRYFLFDPQQIYLPYQMHVARLRATAELPVTAGSLCHFSFRMVDTIVSEVLEQTFSSRVRQAPSSRW